MERLGALYVDPKVGKMALTATATKTTRKCVCNTLGMKHAAVVTQSPNMKYLDKAKATSLEEMFAPLEQEVRLNRTSMERAIIFCQSYDDCSHIYLFPKNRLRKKNDGTNWCSKACEVCFMHTFSACTRLNVKEEVLKSFCDPNGILKIVIDCFLHGT